MNKLIHKLMATYSEWQLKQIGRAWCMVDRPERKHRLRTIIQLSVELEAIKSVSIFSTAFGEQLIEAIIQGDWREAELVLSFLSFQEDGPEVAEKYIPLWEKFNAVALSAINENKNMVAGNKIEPN
jgi:hypothetical protein